MMNTYRYSCSLRLSHPAMDPVSITEALGLSPSRSWRSGDPRSTSQGTPLDGINQETYWSTTISKGALQEMPLCAAVAKSLVELHDKKAFLQRVRREGGTVELFIGWFFVGLSGETFTHDVLARAGDLGIDLAFDVYPDNASGANL